jgi:hypothetical protein
MLSRPPVEFARNAFSTLVGHFIRRLLAGEEETEGGFSLGLGAVLAILASPGAFASIFLLDKYSTLMQWFRHQQVDSYKSSVADEYFFVVLSMTIIGLVTVLRWNRLFPDRRDFANLAIMPIPIRNVFLANVLALFSLAALFAVDVNAFSALFFPFIVTISDGHGGSFAKLVIMLGSHVASVLLASIFSFCSVFAIVGLLMLLVPKRFFALVSLAVRIILIVALLAEFFADLLLQLFSGHLAGATTGYARMLPPFWFLGIYESLAGLNGRGMHLLATRALLATGAAILVSVAAYTICYRRRFVRLAESLETLSGPQHPHRIAFPNALARFFFPTSFERACASFSSSVLARSERHLMFLGGYFGIGLVLSAQNGMDAVNRHVPPLSSDVFAIPLTIAFFVITGFRFVFEMPAALSANWTFRSILQSPPLNPRRPVRTLLLLCVFSWQIGILLPVSVRQLGWPLALAHTSIVMLLSATLIEFLLARFNKIPFTCSNRPDIPTLLMRILGAVFGLMLAVPFLAATERAVLIHPARSLFAAPALAIIWYWIMRRRLDFDGPAPRVIFEDDPTPQFELLKLT